MPLTPGQTLYHHRYQIIELIGQGGFGAVYRVYDTSLSQICALKENFDPGKAAQNQFHREASLLANLRHPHLPRVIDHFVILNQGQYLVMDYIEGKSLGDILANRHQPFTEAEVLPWFGQVCQAVSYLHNRSQPVIHRDIKPQNIIINSENQAVLVDFGISKIYDPTMKTTVGAQAISPGFSPLEQYGQNRTDARTDIYALGATLYMLLTNQRPPEAVNLVAGQGTLTLPRHLNPHISPQTEQAVLQAMALNAKDRFQTVPAFQAALGLMPSSPITPPPAIPPSPTIIAETTPQKTGWPLWTAIGGVGLLIMLFLLGGVMWLFMSQNTGDTTAAELTTPTPLFVGNRSGEDGAAAEPLQDTPTATIQAALTATHTATLTPSPTTALTPTPSNTATPTITSSPTASATPPPTYTPGPPPTPTVPPDMGMITLQGAANNSGQKTQVQWGDDANNWHNVDNWQGPLDQTGRISWLVWAKDFNSGPFRWVVYNSNGSVSFESQPFYLPGAGRNNLTALE